MKIAERIAKLTLNGHQRAFVNRMAAHGIHYPVWTLKVRDQVARDTHGVVGLPLACALLEQESGGGRNVWGHDPAPNGGTSAWGGQSVSKGGYLAYRARRGSHGQGGMQGVGPCQLTWYGFQDRADQQGGCWEPRANMYVGLSDLASQIVGHGHREGIRAYNGSGAAAERYADSVLALERKWTVLLNVQASKPKPKPKPAPAKPRPDPAAKRKVLPDLFGRNANGRLPDAILAPIPNGRLWVPAAAAWNAMCRAAHEQIRAEGPQGSYRDLPNQQRLWALYQSGRGNLAARPGTSNHGLGHAVDVVLPAGRAAVDRHGAPFGWAKRWSDAPSEAWHLVWNPSVWVNPQIRQTQQLLNRYAARQHQKGRIAEDGKWGPATNGAIRSYQTHHGLDVDGIPGPRTLSSLKANT